MAQGNRPAPLHTDRLPTAAAKDKVLESLTRGMTVMEGLNAAGMAARSTYEAWRRSDAHFAHKADVILARRKGTVTGKVVPDFPEFAERYLHEPLFNHQLQWVDMLDGKTPRNLHPSQTYEPGEPDRLLISTPPNHGKTNTLTVNRTTWAIVENPNLRVIVVSKNQRMAQTFIYGIRQRLTSQKYQDLQIDFGPEGGFSKAADSWTATQIILGGKDDGQKDPTVQALGMGGQIYGARADLIVLDDCVNIDNAHNFEMQALWLSQEVVTRLEPGTGKLLVVGTRVGAMDLYKHLREAFPGVYTYLSQPAVLEMASDPKDWVTLWPRATVQAFPKDYPDVNGMWRRWDGPALHSRQREVSAQTWALAYMQQDVSVISTFPEGAVRAAVNGQRTHGLLTVGATGHRKEGMAGLYRICSMDPALTGYCAALVYGVDTRTKQRYVLDVWNEANITPGRIYDRIRTWTLKYKPHQWVIEKNAMNKMITQDEPTRQFLLEHGCVMREHYTSGSKWDPDFGVASMATLFLPALEDPPRKPLIELPHGRLNAACDQLVNQLVTWTPESKSPMDIVMALWFAEIRARELVDKDRSMTHMKNRYLSRARRAVRGVLNLDDEFAAAEHDPQDDMVVLL